MASAAGSRWSAAAPRRPERRRRPERTSSCWTTWLLRYRPASAWVPARSAQPVLRPSNLQELRAAAQALKREFPNVLIEASGGVTPGELPLYFSPQVDIISLGCITQGCPVVDFSLKVQKPAESSSQTRHHVEKAE